jgi:hypothetical protein
MFSRMPFDATTQTLLEYYTANPPTTEDVWYGPWNANLNALFPTSNGYVVSPQRVANNDDDRNRIPDFVIFVLRIAPPLRLQPVLVVKIKNTHHWPSGIDRLDAQINLQTDAALAGVASNTIYSIGAIGPHWRYGKKENDDQPPTPLIDWNNTIHDATSFNHFQTLAGLVAAL